MQIILKKSLYLFVLISSLTACSGSNDGNDETPSSDDPIIDTPIIDPTVIENAIRYENNTCIPPLPQFVGGEPGVTKAFPSLPSIPSVLAMVQPLNDDSFWFILNRSGNVYAFDNVNTVNSYEHVLDISAKVTTVGEMGMTGIAFHPNFGQNEDRVFILYNDINNENRSTISSFTVNQTTKQIDSASEQLILTVEQPEPFHNGGDLAFGTDGMLYAAFGDSERQSRSQQLHNLHGSLIRIDINNTPYSIPSDNPFNTGQSICQHYDGARTEDCPEVYAHGFRNPWRFSIDSTTGIPWVGDVGDSSYEEVDRVVSGGNYGWPIMEGAQCVESNCDTSLYQLPIADYGRDLGVSVVGGYVYRGSQSPTLEGKYIFSDVYAGNVFNVDAESNAVTDEDILISHHGAASMAEGNNGEIYFLSYFNDDENSLGENVYHLSGGGGSTITMPQNLSDIGCFNTATKSSASGVFDYSINSPLWSDGAEKLRSFAIPNNTTIDVLSDGDFDFPENTVLMKHFLHNDDFIETRLFINHSIGWRGYSYEWNDEQTEATLLDEGKTKDIEQYTHSFPTQTECGECHTSAANFSVGIELSQLNKHDDLLNANIIDYLNSANYFSQSTISTDVNQLYALDDESASLELRARSYLHTNCSMCHRPGTTNRSTMDLRFSTSFSDTNTCNADPVLSGVGNGTSKLISAGDAENSIILMRMMSDDPNTVMPPIARLIEDTEATTLIGEWINSLESCN